MRFRLAATSAAILLLVAMTGLSIAETVEIPEKGEMVQSMSFPKLWMFRTGVSYVLNKAGEENHGGGELNLSLYRDLMNPNMGILGAVVEGYIGQSGGEARNGIRLMGSMKFFMFLAGADYSFSDDDWSTIFSFQLPIRRGGMFGKGGDIRIDWFPWRGNSLSFGLNIPIGQPYMGKTRPVSAHAE